MTISNKKPAHLHESATFQFLLANLNRADETGVLYCDGQIAQANYIYPIAGEIGVYKTVKSFFELCRAWRPVG